MTTIGGYPTTTKQVSLAALRALPVHRYAGYFRPVEGDELKRLRASIRAGYDEAHPIIVWKKTGEIVDGRNRRALAAEEGTDFVPVAVVAFPDEEEVARYVIQQNLARRHLSTKERAELAATLVNGGMSTRRAAKATGVSKDTARRAAAKDRATAGGSGAPPPRSRTTGADGKSYPSTRSNPTRKTPEERHFDTMARHYADVVRAQDSLRVMLVGCVVTGRHKRRQIKIEVASIGYEPDGRAYVTGGEGGTDRLFVEDIMRIEKMPPRP
jgi:transposase-like protein